MITRPRNYKEARDLMIRKHNIEFELLRLGCKIADWERTHQDWTWRLYHPLPIMYRKSIEQLCKEHGEMTRILNDILTKLHGELSLNNDQWGRW